MRLERAQAGKGRHHGTWPALARCSPGARMACQVRAYARARGHAGTRSNSYTRDRVRESPANTQDTKENSRKLRGSVSALDLWRVQIRARTASKPQTMKIIRKIRALVSDATFRCSFGSVSSKLIRTIDSPKKARRVSRYAPTVLLTTGQD